MKPPEVPFPRAAQLPPYGENKKRNFRREREGDRLKEKPNNNKKKKRRKRRRKKTATSYRPVGRLSITRVVLYNLYTPTKSTLARECRAPGPREEDTNAENVRDDLGYKERNYWLTSLTCTMHANANIALYKKKNRQS